MYLPPLQPIVNSEIRLDGDVQIHPTASIAPGVILKAAIDSRIVIGPDVCLGMGVIISAHNGSVEIEAGVTLGSGVLIIGSSKIGANACIGTTTTIFNASVESMTVVNPGSIIGDNSRSWQADNNQVDNNNNKAIAESIAPPQNNLTPDNEPVAESASQEKEISAEISNLESNSQDKEAIQQNNSLPNKKVINASTELADLDPWEQEEISKIISDVELEKKDQKTEISPAVAIGKVYIDQLLVTLFPHKNSLNNNSNNNGK